MPIKLLLTGWLFLVEGDESDDLGADISRRAQQKTEAHLSFSTSLKKEMRLTQKME